jgi:ketosteroid isomerase-like protein
MVFGEEDFRSDPRSSATKVQSSERSRNMSNDNVVAVRNAYAVAERKDLDGWISLFTPDGVFTDNSVGATYRGRDLAYPVPNYGTAFSNMHRELYRIYSDGNVVLVQLALQGTHNGPLKTPFGELRATGKQMDAPCCDVFELQGGKIKHFDCYPEGSIIFAQLGVLTRRSAAHPEQTGPGPCAVIVPN